MFEKKQITNQLLLIVFVYTHYKMNTLWLVQPKPMLLF